MAPKKPHTFSELRIIAGQFRSRKITFCEENGLRPTHNRIRETLFNWLTPSIENTRCLDAFAGSGVLGFEALSRGAAHTTFCDVSFSVISQLKKNALQLTINNANFYQCDFIRENTIKNEKFDIVFLDPPYQKKLLIPACELLLSRELLNPHALIYLEFEKDSVDLSRLPKQLVIKKHKETKTIEYVLCTIISDQLRALTDD